MSRLDADPQRVAGGTVDAATVEMQVALMLRRGPNVWPHWDGPRARRRTGGQRPFGPTSHRSPRCSPQHRRGVRRPGVPPQPDAAAAAAARSRPALGRRTGRLFAYGPPSYDQATPRPARSGRGRRRGLPSRYTGGFAAPGAPPIVVVGTTGDPDTPYPDAVALAQTLASAKLITFRGEGHTAFLRSACVTAQVTNYLVDLALPGKEVCDDEAPVPGG